MHRLGTIVVAGLFLLVATEATAAADDPPDPPPPRSRAEVDLVLNASQPAPESASPLRILLVAGPKTHGPLQHDYPRWQQNWSRLLARAPSIVVDTAFPWPAAEHWAEADVAVFYFYNPWTAAQIEQLTAFQIKGRGVVLIHWAVGSEKNAAALAERIGLAYPPGHYRHGPVTAQINSGHPVTQGFPEQLHLYDEAYWPLVGDTGRVNVLGTSKEAVDATRGTAPLPLYWTFETDEGGRVFAFIPGHYMWTFDDPLQRLLLLRGIAWAAGTPVTRFDTLCLDGAATTP